MSEKKTSRSSYSQSHSHGSSESNSVNDARLNDLMRASKAESSRRTGSGGGSREGGTISSGSAGGTGSRSSRHRPPRDDRSLASSTDAGTPRRISSRGSADDMSVASHSSSKGGGSGGGGGGKDHRSSAAKSSSSRRSRRDGRDSSEDELLDSHPNHSTFGDTEPFFDFGSFPAMGSEIPAFASAFNDESNDNDSNMDAGADRNADTTPIVNPPVDCSTPPRIELGDARTIWTQDVPMTPSPKANPLTGRLVLVVPSKVADGSTMTLMEWNAHTQSPVCSTPLMSPELLTKLQLKYPSVISSVRRIEKVLQLAVGVHDAHGYTRARVAVLMTLQIQDYQWRKDLLTIIGIYQWNYGSAISATPTSCPLQSVLIPPSGADFTYETESLLMAESCVFLAGHSTQKGPCVFISQPLVKETWSANFVERTGRISAMAVVHTSSIHTKEKPQKHGGTDVKKLRLPYIAIALADGSLSVWTYEAAMKPHATSKRNITTAAEANVARRMLYPLCRLDTSILHATPATDWERNTTMVNTAGAPVTAGYCSSLEWIPPTPTAQNRLPILSAAFQGGLAIYHVGLPKLLDASTKKYMFPKPPSEKTRLSQTPSLSTIAVICWPQAYKEACIAFVDLGPHMPSPSVVALLIQDKDGNQGLGTKPKKTRMVVVSYDCPISGITPSEPSLRVWDSRELDSNAKGLVPGTSCPGILYHTDRTVQVARITLSQLGRRWNLIRGGIVSIPPGLTTAGTVYASDCDNSKGNPHKDGILQVFSTTYAERRKGQDRLEWNSPSRRHWLVETRIGDYKEASAIGLRGPEDAVVLGGTTSNVVAELSAGLGSPLGKLYPLRLCRRDGVAAVVFHSFSKDLSQIGIVDQHQKDKPSGIAQLIEGRDAAFVSNTQLLVLGRNGGSISVWQRSDESWKSLEPSYRPIVGVNPSSANEYVHCERIFSTESQGFVGLIAVGHRASTNKSCILVGKSVSALSIDLQNMLPHLNGTAFWLDYHEYPSNVLILPSEQDKRGGVVVSTSHRLMILDPITLSVLSSVAVQVSPSSLVALGSYTVAYVSQEDNKIRYLSALPGSFGTHGSLASLPSPQYDYNPYSVLAIRPDRIVYTCTHVGSRLVERGQESQVFLMPIAVTRPALLLEPMIANAIATGREHTVNQPFFRTIMEKFGRKVATMTHGEGEGIGNHGVGITPRVFELLDFYNLQAAASWLLTGTPQFTRSCNSRLSPAWMPISTKIKGAMDSSTNLHAIASGDQYFSEYVKSPDNNMTATLPRPSDPSAVWGSTFALEYLQKGKVHDAVAMFDVAGTDAADTILLQLLFAMQIESSKDLSPILNSLFNADSQMGKIVASNPTASIAALAADLQKTRGVADEDFSKEWMRPLAPSIQRGRRLGRSRPRIIGESALELLGRSEPFQDRLFITEILESKLVWNEGPNREKENLLMLDNFQEWFGRRRPLVMGKEGVKSAEDRGASTLADILAQPDDDSFNNGDAHDDLEVGWVDGVGEGQKDEDKLSAYFRFSEGEDEESTWRNDGFADLTKFESRALLVGCADSALLEDSSSSVDVGDPGKVKPIFDLVFSASGVDRTDALVISASRGSSLDVGIMHGPERTARQKMSLEFWFWVPESVSSEVVLARRTFGSSADDTGVICSARNKGAALWQLTLTTSGELEFRTIAGNTVCSSAKPPIEDDEKPQSTVVFDRWNHVCITMKQQDITSCKVIILVKGSIVCEKVMSFKPPDHEDVDRVGASSLDAILEKSHLVFGLNHPAHFRLTELRVWATDRDEADVRTMMTEYLEAAEMKRKFRVKIKKMGDRHDGKLAIGGAGGLAPKPTQALPSTLTPPKVGLAPPKGALNPPKDSLLPSREEKSTQKPLLSPPKVSEAPETITGETPFDGFHVTPVSSGAFEDDVFGELGADMSAPVSFDSDFVDNGAFQTGVSRTFESEDEDFDEIEVSPLWDSAIPLSEQVRSSAASALIRGPPATRHFGGNRGGLPDYREMDRFGVGAITICGSEKTIVWRDDQVPPGLTYPIGASGAIVSDQMDEDGSEFLCCFLAKEKRMVVFELSTRTVVVELQMTTKLNYWRFLPPEAGEDTLCFMLITPVGGFHWQALDESPRPRQVWKRPPELQSKKVVCYEEGGTNGMDGPDIISRVGMLLVTSAAESGSLEVWVVPICGDSKAVCACDEVLGGCLCQPPGVGFEPWMPLLLFVVESREGDLVVCISAVASTSDVSIGVTDVVTDALIEMESYRHKDYEPPNLAMGSWPEVLCCSLGGTIVVIVRRKGLVVAYELADTGLELIAQEHVGHFVVDAVMRYSAVEGGAEIVLLMSDSENHRDGRVGTFCFRTSA